MHYSPSIFSVKPDSIFKEKIIYNFIFFFLKKMSLCYFHKINYQDTGNSNAQDTKIYANQHQEQNQVRQVLFSEGVQDSNFANYLKEKVGKSIP